MRGAHDLHLLPAMQRRASIMVLAIGCFQATALGLDVGLVDVVFVLGQATGARHSRYPWRRPAYNVNMRAHVGRPGSA